MSHTPRGPHESLATESPQQRLLAELFDRLWDRYRGRVSYVAEYENNIAKAGATFFNDHIAFRTFATQQPVAGIVSLSRVFEPLGYRAAGCYHFENKQLFALHFQHPNPQFPKLFISELKTWELPASSRKIIERVLADHRPPLELSTLSALHELDAGKQSDNAQLIEKICSWIEERPWPAPEKSDVLALNEVSQYAAWVLLHGYNVNHFTSLINSHGVESLDDIEKTVAALQSAGVPMKSEIEGAAGSKLRQTATEAVVIDVPVRDGGAETTMPWTYAYFELAERGEFADPTTGQATRFEGFLGPQATHLFEMTAKS